MVEVRPPINPLQSTQAIVDQNGKPTQYFLRQWLAQQGVNLTGEETTEEINDLTVQVAANLQAINVLIARNLTAGIGLEGGGDLSQDRTFDLSNTAVTPASYTNTNLTVDQQGRITSAADGTVGSDLSIEDEGAEIISAATIINFVGAGVTAADNAGTVDVTIPGGGGGGGGGSNWAWPIEIDDVASTSAFAFKGAVFRFLQNINITQIGCALDSVSTHTYNVGVYRLDGSDNIDEVTGVGTATVSPGTITRENIVIPLVSAAVCVSGSRYAIVFGVTNLTDTTPVPMFTEATGSNQNMFPNIPARINEFSPTISTQVARIAQASPAIGDAVDVGAAGVFIVGVGFTIP